MTINTTILNGEILIKGLEKYNAKRVIIEIKPFNPELKTLQQLRWYYGIIFIAIAKNQGYEKYEYEGLHIELKRMFLTNHYISKITGEEFEGTPSLKNITKRKMIEYLDEITRFAVKLGIEIPEPITAFEQN